MGNLRTYAHAELTRAGFFADDAPYDGFLAQAVMELVEVFEGQDHSGFSADMTLQVFDTVARLKPLTALTSDPNEWMFVTFDLWQSRRRPTTFSRDGGQTWYDIADPSLNNGDVYRRDEE